MALDKLGRHGEAQIVFEQMASDERVSRKWHAEIYLQRDDKDKAFEILQDMSVEENEITSWITGSGVRPLAEPEDNIKSLLPSFQFGQ